uniref:Cytochrome b n=1 Tax=Aegilips sp. ZJUH 20220002 TaxID=2943451 RepID=A0A9E8G6T0_9HYME|nr:cytochrome b [Aegilips sp. ZJUH 20220002]
MKMDNLLFVNLKNLKSMIMYLPTPVNINILWNFGSLLGIFLMIQVISGLFLSMHYTCCVSMAFQSIIYIIHDVNYGWFIRLIHMNGASFFFFLMYIHIGRGLYYCSYFLKNTWLVGSLIYLFSMGTAFLGYVLPWGQMSLWGATVITNLLSAIPYLGEILVMWLWGGFNVNNATLNRFYSLHFLMPLLIVVLVVIHLMFLHNTGSNNPIGLNSNLYKVSFYNYYFIKDLQGFIMVILILLLINCWNPYYLGDPENFSMANFMVTPIHIQPEWYFLFAYAILRSIPNKLGGVIGLLFSVLIIMILPFFNLNMIQGLNFYPFNQMFYWIFINVFFLLTWIGMKTIEYPYELMGKILTLMYFLYYLMNIMIFEFWDYYIFKN